MTYYQKKTRVLLVRHGESEANNNGFFAGQYDALLMPKGIEQAEKTAKYIVEKYAPTINATWGRTFYGTILLTTK